MAGSHRRSKHLTKWQWGNRFSPWVFGSGVLWASTSRKGQEAWSYSALSQPQNQRGVGILGIRRKKASRAPQYLASIFRLEDYNIQQREMSMKRLWLKSSLSLLTLPFLSLREALPHVQYFLRCSSLPVGRLRRSKGGPGRLGTCWQIFLSCIEAYGKILYLNQSMNK